MNAPASVKIVRQSCRLLAAVVSRAFHPDRGKEGLAAAAQSFEPPSARTVSPVIQRASSEARKATTPPMSSG